MIAILNKLLVVSNGHSSKDGDIGGGAIREMTLELDSRFGVDPSFKFSHGWFEGFKRRYKLKSYRRNGEGASSDAAAVSNGRDQIASVIAQYPWERVYNMDETAKLYNLRPTHTYATSKVRGFKQAKDRLTVAVCDNAIWAVYHWQG